MKLSFFLCVCTACCLTLTNSIFSEQLCENKAADEKQVQKDVPKEAVVVTSHTVKIGGADIAYKAVVGTQLLKDEQGNPKASMFYIAYTKEDVVNDGKRPVTFCFNGGPGAASVWLNLGIFGPRCIDVNESGLAIKQHFQLLENSYSLLDITDLVFIDPVSTGYSRAVPVEKAKDFHGVEEDVQSVAEFIRLYTTRNELWESPKFLAGESYGTTRAVGLALELNDKHHLSLDGLLLISTLLNFQTISFSAGNDLPYILFLPAYTATAFYHHKLPADLQQNFSKTLAEVQEFAYNEYSKALMYGDNLGENQQKIVLDKLARYTGLSRDYLALSHLRVSIFRFAKELLRSERRTVGRFDSRAKGIDNDLCSDSYEFDPSFENIMGPFAAAFNNYVRTELNWKSDEEYKILANVWPWNYSTATNHFLDVGDKLKEVMNKNHNLEVYVASGYYDLAIPYWSEEYSFSHLGLDPVLRKNIIKKTYEGGHMMYLYKPTLMQMKADIAEFIQQRLNKRNEAENRMLHP